LKFDALCAEKEIFYCGLLLVFSVGAEGKYTTFFRDYSVGATVSRCEKQYPIVFEVQLGHHPSINAHGIYQLDFGPLTTHGLLAYFKCCVALLYMRYLLIYIPLDKHPHVRRRHHCWGWAGRT
jgi:hypothetical protein